MCSGCFIYASLLWILILGLVAVGGFMSSIGSFGRWMAPYLLSAAIGITVALISGIVVQRWVIY